MASHRLAARPPNLEELPNARRSSGGKILPGNPSRSNCKRDPSGRYHIDGRTSLRSRSGLPASPVGALLPFVLCRFRGKQLPGAGTEKNLAAACADYKAAKERELELDQ